MPESPRSLLKKKVTWFDDRGGSAPQERLGVVMHIEGSGSDYVTVNPIPPGQRLRLPWRELRVVPSSEEEGFVAGIKKLWRRR